MLAVYVNQIRVWPTRTEVHIICLQLHLKLAGSIIYTHRLRRQVDCLLHKLRRDLHKIVFLNPAPGCS